METKTTKHFSEAELLETHYTQPGESMPVMMHLASCAECAAKYERLEKKLRGIASCPSEKPQTFWTRQRLQTMRRIDTKSHQHDVAERTWRVAAAAVLAFVLGGFVTFKTVEPELKRPPIIVQADKTTPAIVKSEDGAHDAWQSDELRDFHSMVQWESWVDDSNKTPEGGSSL